MGFRSVGDAQAAVKYFNRSFMGAQRLTVEFAEKYGGSHLPRAWSKYTEGTSRYKKLHQVLRSFTSFLPCYQCLFWLADAQDGSVVGLFNGPHDIH